VSKRRSELTGQSRREFLNLAASGLVAGCASAASANSTSGTTVEAVAFDAFTVFDPSRVAEVAETVFPGQGAALSAAWRTRQFEYTWLRTTAGHYDDFWTVTGDALVFAARMLRLELTAARRQRLMQVFLDLRAYPDAQAALASLRQMGLRLAFLTNMTAPMVEAAVRHSRLEGLFEAVLSTDRVRAYKPDPRAYRMANDVLGVPRDAVVFVAFGGWDAAGAKWFGYQTFWVNRAGAPLEQLGVEPDGIGHDLDDLARFLKSYRRAETMSSRGTF
jgi:2-haloacid dehalogenase